MYNSSGKAETYNPQPSSSRQTPNRIEDLKALGKKGAGSGASSGKCAVIKCFDIFKTKNRHLIIGFGNLGFNNLTMHISFYLNTL